MSEFIFAFVAALGIAGFVNWTLGRASQRMTGKPIATFLVLTCLSVLMPQPCQAAPPKELYGKSIVLRWTEARVQREVELGEQHPQSVGNTVELTIYISTAGRMFSRQHRVGYVGGHAGAAATFDHAPGEPHMPGIKQGHTNFQGSTMTQVGVSESGARQVTVDFGPGLSSCTLRVLQGKENGRPQIVRSQITGRKLEVLSVAINSPTCSVRDGNALAPN
jgi:hypothetical protein